MSVAPSFIARSALFAALATAPLACHDKSGGSGTAPAVDTAIAQAPADAVGADYPAIAPTTPAPRRPRPKVPTKNPFDTPPTPPPHGNGQGGGGTAL